MIQATSTDPVPAPAVEPNGESDASVRVARLFRAIADLLAISGAADRNTVRAYRTAARQIKNQAAPNTNLLTAAPAGTVAEIAPEFAAAVEEIMTTGGLRELNELRARIPIGLTDLLRIPGLGPTRIGRLHRELGICNAGDLVRAIQTRRFRTLAGFGPHLEASILATAIGPVLGDRRHLRPTVAPLVHRLTEYLLGDDGVERLAVAGSYRRRTDTIGNLTLLVTRSYGLSLGRLMASFPDVERIASSGPTRASVHLMGGLRVDARIVAPASFGAALQYHTGSRAHNAEVRRTARRRGLKVNEHGVYRARRRLPCGTEEEVYDAIGLPWIPPELREGRGETTAGLAGTLPHLVTPSDLRGDLHVYSTDLDGRDCLDSVADNAEARGYEYIAIVDCASPTNSRHGIDRAELRRRMRRIDRLNGRPARLTILKGANVEILPDGSLSLDDSTLAALDVVVASIHSTYDLDRVHQTRRIVRALRHGPVDILAHPTCRLLGKRPPLDVDMADVVRAAADHHVMMEINAQPERLDLDDANARRALQAGVRLVVGTGARSGRDLGLADWGIDQARRAWAEVSDVANTRSLPQLLALLHGRR